MRDHTKGRQRCVWTWRMALIGLVVWCLFGTGCVSRCKQVRAPDDYEEDWYAAEVAPCKHPDHHKGHKPRPTAAKAAKPKPVRWELWLFPKLPR